MRLKLLLLSLSLNLFTLSVMGMERHASLPVNDTNFSREVLQGQGLVLVDFYAPYCRACINIAPSIEQLARENNGTIKITTFNISNGNKSAAPYAIAKIPTFLLFKNGKVIDRLVGGTKEKISEMLNKHR